MCVCVCVWVVLFVEISPALWAARLYYSFGSTIKTLNEFSESCFVFNEV